MEDNIPDRDIRIGMDLAEHAAAEALNRVAQIVKTAENGNQAKVAAAYASALIISKLQAARHVQDDSFGAAVDGIIGTIQPHYEEEARRFDKEWKSAKQQG